MAKRRESRAHYSGPIRRTDLAKILRAIKAMKDRHTPGSLATTAALRARGRDRNRALRRKVGPLLVSKAEIRKAEPLIAQYNKESAALFRKATVAARKSFLSSRKGPRARIISPLEAANSAQLTGFGNRSAYVVLQPIATVARPTGMLWDTQALGTTGLAKIYFSADGQGSGSPSLEFWYTWVNAATDEVRVNVSCPVLFRGVCSTHADIGLFWGGESLIHIEVSLDVYEWWKTGHPHNSPTFDTRATVLNMSTSTGGFWGDNVQESQPVGDYQRLRYGTLAVPPGGRVMTRVKVHPFYSISGSGGFLGGGYISIDFASESTYAIIPTMMLEVINLTPPLDPNP